jgi:hypothetical protein
VNVISGPTAEKGILSKNMNIYTECVADTSLRIFILLSNSSRVNLAFIYFGCALIAIIENGVLKWEGE